MTVGVLALQGAFREHRQRLEQLGAGVREVRLPADLAGLSGLILPGGESTTMVRLLTAGGLWQPLRDFHASGGALWGTCAGAIVLAREVTGGSPSLPPQPGLGLLDITVQRNAFGRQVDSFTAPLDITGLGTTGLGTPFPAVFIRAPVITRVGPAARALAQVGDRTVHVQQGRVLASAFHPELTEDTRLHRVFLSLAGERAY